MTEQHDQELRDHLAGKSAVSRLYQQAHKDEPSPELDERIRAAAREPVVTPRPRWIRPLSAAAVIVLAMGVLLQMQQEGITPLPTETDPAAMPVLQDGLANEPSIGTAAQPTVEQLRSSSKAKAEAQAEMAPMQSSPMSADSMESPAVERQDPPAPAARESVTPKRAPTTESRMAAPARAQESPHDAMADTTQGEAAGTLPAVQDWIEHIRQLRAQGHHAEAEAQYRELRQHYPDYPIPDDLRQAYPEQDHE